MTLQDLQRAQLSDIEAKPLSEQEISDLVTVLPNWGVDQDTEMLTTNFELQNFQEALTLINAIGEVAEENQHHPDIFLYDYNNVLIQFTTHDADNSVTIKDFIVAAKIEKMIADSEVMISEEDAV